MRSFVTYAPMLFFFAGGLLAMSFVARFNLRTYQLVRRVQEAAAADGNAWAFWNRLDRQLQFVLRPSSLIDVTDSVSVLDAKRALLAHRLTMHRSLAAACGVFVAAILISIVILFVGARL